MRIALQRFSESDDPRFGRMGSEALVVRRAKEKPPVAHRRLRSDRIWNSGAAPN